MPANKNSDLTCKYLCHGSQGPCLNPPLMQEKNCGLLSSTSESVDSSLILREKSAKLSCDWENFLKFLETRIMLALPFFSNGILDCHINYRALKVYFKWKYS